MKPLYTPEEYKAAKSTDHLPCECYVCQQPFQKLKKNITASLKGTTTDTIKYCSTTCAGKGRSKRVSLKCKNCETIFERKRDQVKKAVNHFCSRSCNATYRNKNKQIGTRRSKLEVWLEAQLTELFPSLEIHFNQSEAIGSELDIYIPSLNVAFELNGIFHYEPIYGVDKLERIQENDHSKTKTCHDSKIDLCVIDTSGQKYVKPKTSQKYLDIITNIIKERINS